MVFEFLDKKSTGRGIKNEIKQNKHLTESLNKPIIRKFENRKVHSSFEDNIWGTDLADMQLINKFDKGICFFMHYWYF